MSKEKKPPEKIVVSWTDADWRECWPHRFEKMINETPLAKAPFIASLIKRAVTEFEETGKIYETSGRYGKTRRE